MILVRLRMVSACTFKVRGTFGGMRRRRRRRVMSYAFASRSRRLGVVQSIKYRRHVMRTGICYVVGRIVVVAVLDDDDCNGEGY